MKRSTLWTIGVVAAVLLLAYFILSKPAVKLTDNIAECIGENSIVYEQLGCHACETQQELFGEDYEYLNSVDCFFEREKCSDAKIRATPTWVIDGKKIEGVQSIEKLQELTGCQLG